MDEFVSQVGKCDIMLRLQSDLSIFGSSRVIRVGQQNKHELPVRGPVRSIPVQSDNNPVHFYLSTKY